MNRRKNIGFKFLRIISVILGIFFCASLYFFWTGSNAHMKDMLKDKAELALNFDLAIRSYIAETVRPFAQKYTDEGVFIPEVMSTSFVARSIFDKVRQKHPDYTIKFSSDNPRNPSNLAGAEELKVIEYFNSNPKAEKWSGEIKMNGREYIGLFSARPMEKSCLQCHGVPEDAPASLIAQYGDKAGFHRPIGEVIALDTVAMPVEKYEAAAAMQALKISFVLMVGLTLLLVIVYYTFQRLVGHRLTVIAEHFKNATRQDGKAVIEHLEFNHKNNDEISSLAKSFNVMIDNLLKGTTSIGNLNLEISERNKAEESLKETHAKLERFNRLMVGREERVIDMKKEVNGLLAELGREPQYESVLGNEKIGLSFDISGKDA